MYDLSASMIGLMAQRDPEGLAKMMAEQGIAPPPKGAKPMMPELGALIGQTAMASPGTVGGVGLGVPGGTGVPPGMLQQIMGNLGAPQGGLGSALQGMAAPNTPQVDPLRPSTPAAPRPDAVRPSDALLQMLLGARPGGPMPALGGR